MSKTPAQKRRCIFHSGDDWACWACAVVAAEGSWGLRINEYSWRSGSRDLQRGLAHAIKRGWVTRIPSHPARAEYQLTELGKSAAAKHKENCKRRKEHSHA